MPKAGNTSSVQGSADISRNEATGALCERIPTLSSCGYAVCKNRFRSSGTHSGTADFFQLQSKIHVWLSYAVTLSTANAAIDCACSGIILLCLSPSADVHGGAWRERGQLLASRHAFVLLQPLPATCLAKELSSEC